MFTTLDVDLNTIDLRQVGRLLKGEIQEYAPTAEVRVTLRERGYEQNLQVTKVVRDGEVGSPKFTFHLEDGAEIPMDLYAGEAIQMKVRFVGDLQA